MEQKQYLNIFRLRDDDLPDFHVGDHIIVEEKIDGANFSFRYDAEKDQICSFSRRVELHPKNTLFGAWEWSQKLDKKKIAEVLGNNLIMFAEWLAPHTVKYPDKKYFNAYCFDIMNTETEQYLPQEQVNKVVQDLGLSYVPVFYDGPFTSWEALASLVGRTELGGEYGEGIVIKNMTRLNDPDENFQFYVKIVGEAFKEKKAIGGWGMKMLDRKHEKSVEQELTESVVTTARVRKLILKMVDEQELPINWKELDPRTIMRKLSNAVYYDCVKEEPDTVEQVGKEFGKYAAITARSELNELMKIM